MGRFKSAKAAQKRRKGLTLVELLITLAVALAITIIAFPLLFGRARPTGTRSLKDSTQVRGLYQAIELWSEANGGAFLMPSYLDAEHHTVNAPPEEKNTTANIISLLIFNSYVSPEIMVSPAEVNPNIRSCTTYEYTSPSKAAAKNKSLALWDPGFSADFTSANGGHISYAHSPPIGKRRDLWRIDRTSAHAVIGNRGPQITPIGTTFAAKTGAARVPGQPVSSNTYLIHGPRNTWEGNIAFADGHIEFLRSMVTATHHASLTTGTEQGDNLFLDEPHDESGLNSFLGIWTKSSASIAESTAIWD